MTLYTLAPSNKTLHSSLILSIIRSYLRDLTVCVSCLFNLYAFFFSCSFVCWRESEKKKNCLTARAWMHPLAFFTIYIHYIHRVCSQFDSLKAAQISKVHTVKWINVRFIQVYNLNESNSADSRPNFRIVMKESRRKKMWKFLLCFVDLFCGGRSSNTNWSILCDTERESCWTSVHHFETQQQMFHVERDEHRENEQKIK